MKVLFLLHQGNMYSGGQGVYTAQVTRELARLGHDVHLIVGPPWPDIDPAVTVHRVPSFSIYRLIETNRRFFYGRDPLSFFHPLNFYELGSSRGKQFSVMSAFSWRAYMKWRELQAEQRFDIVHDVQSLGYGTLMIHASGMPVVANVHHPLSIDRANQVMQARTLRKKIGNIWFYPYFMQEIVARRIDRVITGSHASLESVRGAFSLRPDAITAIWDGVDTSVFYPRGLPRRPGSLLYVGNSDDRNKGARYLVEAAAILRDRGVAFDVTFVGARDAKVVAQMVAHLDLESRVTRTGRLTVDELARAYNETQIMVCPSLYEGFGLPAAEASACGTPVIAAAGGALPEVIADGETGIIVPTANARALADAIQSLLADPTRCEALGAAGARRMADQFSWRRCAEATADLYGDVVERRRARAD